MENINQPKWAFIINPIAGNGFAKTLKPKLEEMIRQHNITAEVVFTDYKSHATELATQFYNQGYKYIIGVGGDGTINEIARALAGNPNVVTGIIPAGTGNDTIQICGFPNRFEDKHWDIFFEHQTKQMDVGSCNGHVFLNGIGLGFDAQVAAANYTKDLKAKKGGADKYMWHILSLLFVYKEKNMIVLNNGERTVKSCFLNTVANGRRFAGDFFLTPKAIADDGLLDVCNVEKLGLFQRVRKLLQVPKGKHIDDKKVHYFQTPKVEIEFDAEMPFHADGEIFFASKFDIQILPSKLEIIYNQQGNHYFKI